MSAEIKITILHTCDGLLKRYNTHHVPRTGEFITINRVTYVIKKVVWSPDTERVRLVVDDLKY